MAAHPRVQQFQISGAIQPVAPFDFDKTLGFLDMFTPMRREQALEANILTKAIMLNGQTYAFQVWSTGTVEAPQIDYTLLSDEPISEQAWQTLENRIRFFLSMDEDLRPFYAIADTDPHFAPIAHQLYGLHQVKFLTPFEIAAWAILCQRIPIPVAQKIKQRLVERYGGSIELSRFTYWAFPEAERLAAVDGAALEEVVRNDRKAAYLGGVARAFASVDEDFLLNAPTAEVERWLRAIKGIGEWSTGFILIRGLGRMDHLPEHEPRLEEAVERRYGTGHTISEIADKFGALKGYWAYYMRTMGETKREYTSYRDASG